MKYFYSFVGYENENNKNIYGNGIIDDCKKIDTYNDIESLENAINKKYNLNWSKILYYKEIRKDD